MRTVGTHSITKLTNVLSNQSWECKMCGIVMWRSHVTGEYFVCDFNMILVHKHNRLILAKDITCNEWIIREIIK